MATVEWWYSSTTFGDFSGQPVGPPEWPCPGGALAQPASLIEASMLLRAEWSHVSRAPAAAPKKKG